MKKFLLNIIRKFKATACSHEFMMQDLQLINIPDLAIAKSNDFEAWQKYHAEIYTHDSVCKRVAWPCSKCGKIFYDSCGLNVLRHGRAVPDDKKKAKFQVYTPIGKTWEPLVKNTMVYPGRTRGADDFEGQALK